MKQLSIFLGLLLISFSLAAQILQPKAKRIYRLGDQVVIADSLGTNPMTVAASLVSVVPFGANYIRVNIDGGADYYRPAQFLNQAGSPYGATVNLATTAYRDGLVALTATAPPAAPAVFGSVAPTSTDYTGSATITTTNAIKVFLENIGTANSAFSYAGLSYTLLPGEQRAFSTERDLTSGKLVPFAALTVNGTASTIRVTLTPKQ